MLTGSSDLQTTSIGSFSLRQLEKKIYIYNLKCEHHNIFVLFVI